MPQIAVDEALWMAAATLNVRAVLIYTRSRKMQDLLARDSLLAPGVDGRRAPRPASSCGAKSAGSSASSPGFFGEAFGRIEIDHQVAAVAAEPRVLDLGELERLRDGLAERVAEARVTLRERAAAETSNRELLRRMLAAPADFKWVRISRDDLGEPGCGHWHSRPRLGPIGMLMGWWRVKVSSGCPLAGRLAAVEQEETGKAK